MTICIIVRIAYFINLSGVRHLYGYVAYFFLSASTTPFTITSALLITFYWCVSCIATPLIDIIPPYIATISII